MKVVDVMKSDVITVHSETSLQELVELFIKEKLSGVPVVDGDNNLAGVISKTDLVTHGLEKELSELLGKKIAGSGTMDIMDFSNMLGDNPGHETVEDIMTTPAITCSPQSDLKEVVLMMLDKQIHRVVVTEDDKIVGLVSTMDIMNAITKFL